MLGTRFVSFAYLLTIRAGGSILISYRGPESSCTLQTGLDSVVMLITWTIWKERNARTFDSRPSINESQLVNISVKKGQLWVQSGAKYMAVWDGRQKGQ